ncbi:MAG: hypothetical protein Q7W45_16570 [Bacteroidota bacterium]|nr:hypothetical protein [Bacteroidota bacterium]MDP3145369.1 hypothetical protein [Bacteroidota bacterium]
MFLTKIKGILRSKGYELYTKPNQLNIVGIRSTSTIPNRFDDEIHVFYKVAPLKWHYHVYMVTTDPGTFWLRNPMQPQGTAILAQGQYKGAYKIGLHQGKYKALVQAKPITVIRDYDRDAKLDFRNGTKSKGLFGINIHRASLNGITKQVDKYSAGCQVFANINEFKEFLGLCEKHLALYGNSFTYTLIDFRSVKRLSFKRWAIGTVTVALGLTALWGILTRKKKK